MNCCSNKKIVDDKAKNRVEKVLNVERRENFSDKIVTINAAADGFTTSAEIAHVRLRLCAG